MPFFSIVIPAYNAGRLIDETVFSLLNQTYTGYEVIVIDDGSSDDTFERLQEYTDRIKVYRQENKGSGSARNLGIFKANGEYIVSFDSDDILFPYALEIYSRVIDYFNGPPIVFSKIQYFNEMNELQFNSWDGNDIHCTKLECFFKKNISFPTINSALIVRKEVLLKISGYPDDPYGYGMDDSRMLFRIGTESPVVVINYPVTVGYRQHSASLSKNADCLFRGVIEYIGDERRKEFPGGKKLKFNRRGLIGSNVLSMFKRRYFGIKNLGRIIIMIFHLRSMVLVAFIRKLASYYYKSEKYMIRLDK